MSRSRIFVGALLFLFAIPNVLASPFSSIIQLLAKITYMPELNNTDYLVVFYRICFFIIFLALFNLVLKKVMAKMGDGGTAANRAPTIIAVVLAIIGSFAMPREYMLMTGNLWMVVIALLATLTIPVALIWLGMIIKGEWWKELLGFAFILLAWALFNAIQINFYQLILTSFQSSLSLVQEIADWSTIIFLILAIVKFIQIFKGSKWGGGEGSWWDNLTPKVPEPRPSPSPTPLPEPGPTPEIPDFSATLGQLDIHLNRFTELFRELLTMMNDILLTNHEFRRGGGYYGSASAPVTHDQWQRLFVAQDQLSRLRQEINNVLNTITNDEQFRDITDEQRTLLVELANKRTDQFRKLESAHQDFLERYEHDLPPR